MSPTGGEKDLEGVSYKNEDFLPLKSMRMGQLNPLSRTLFGQGGQTETNKQVDRQNEKGHNNTTKKVTHTYQCKRANMDIFEDASLIAR